MGFAERLQMGFTERLRNCTHIIPFLVEGEWGYSGLLYEYLRLSGFSGLTT